MLEHWQEIDGYDGMYWISNKGKVKSFQLSLKGELSKRPVNSHGYCIVKLYKKGMGTIFYVHRLVATAFLGDCLDGYECNHKNGIKTDNRAENLEWVTHVDNVKHAFKNGLRFAQRGEEHHNAKLTETAVRDIKYRLGEGEMGISLAEEYGVTKAAISDINTGRNWGWLDDIK